MKTDDVIAALRSSQVGTSIFIADACREDITKGAALFGQQTAERLRRQGVIGFFGCSPGEVCCEHQTLENGVFTHALCQVLDKQGPFTPVEIDLQVISLVNEFCGNLGLPPQHPYTVVMPLQKANVDIFSGQAYPLSIGESRQCVLVLGLHNAGKTTLGTYLASSLGYVHVEMSAFAWKRWQEQADDEESLQDFLEKRVWPTHGKAIIAQDLLSSQSNVRKVVICGARTEEEIELLLAQNWETRMFYLHAHSRLRYRRDFVSGLHHRYDLSYPDLVARDLRELGWGLVSIPSRPGVQIVINERAPTDLFSQVESQLTR
jgi:gluconate kinase